MKNYAIQSGNFTQNGNFSGYTAKGERVFVHKNQMTGAGWAKQEDVKFPFFAIGAIKQIGQLKEDGTPKTKEDGSAVLVDRLQAMSVYPTQAGLIAAHVAEATLNVSIASAVAAEAKSAGLTEEQLKGLLEMA
jgi:hypothetical protein